MFLLLIISFKLKILDFTSAGEVLTVRPVVLVAPEVMVRPAVEQIILPSHCIQVTIYDLIKTREVSLQCVQ